MKSKLIHPQFLKNPIKIMVQLFGENFQRIKNPRIGRSLAHNKSGFLVLVIETCVVLMHRAEDCPKNFFHLFKPFYTFILPLKLKILDNKYTTQAI